VTQTANGTISPGDITVNYGANQTFSITPNSGYHVASVTVDGSPVTPVTSYTFTGVVGEHSISATFAPNPATKLVITTSPRTFTAGATSNTITVQRQDAGNNPVTADGNITINLSSDSTGTWTFRNSSNTADITSVTITNGNSTASFLYRDSKAGTPTITVSASGLTSATQQETVNNPVPTLTSFTPTSVSRNQTRNIVLNGTNFINGVTTVSVESSTYIKLNSYTVTDSSHITANITIGSSTTDRDFTVTNPGPGGGSATLTLSITY
jgi:hypothetical protein